LHDNQRRRLTPEICDNKKPADRQDATGGFFVCAGSDKQQPAGHLGVIGGFFMRCYNAAMLVKILAYVVGILGCIALLTTPFWSAIARRRR
jgi:hypothetical protein